MQNTDRLGFGGAELREVGPATSNLKVSSTDKEKHGNSSFQDTH
jgi:hypothetical protein